MIWVCGCFASTGTVGVKLVSRPAFSEYEPAVDRLAVRRSSRDIWLQGVAGQRCEASVLPQALATPDPLLSVSRLHGTVAVSFVVGTDGRVHSPVILESAGADADELVLDAVRSWRFRPATCNATPTEAESRIEFSRR